MVGVSTVKPRVRFSDEANIHQGVMYTTLGKLEQVRCIVDAYPRPVMSLLRNEVPISEQSYTFDKNNEVKDQVSVSRHSNVSPYQLNLSIDSSTCWPTAWSAHPKRSASISA